MPFFSYVLSYEFFCVKSAEDFEMAYLGWTMPPAYHDLHLARYKPIHAAAPPSGPLASRAAPEHIRPQPQLRRDPTQQPPASPDHKQRRQTASAQSTAKPQVHKVIQSPNPPPPASASREKLPQVSTRSKPPAPPVSQSHSSGTTPNTKSRQIFQSPPAVTPFPQIALAKMCETASAPPKHPQFPASPRYPSPANLCRGFVLPPESPPPRPPRPACSSPPDSRPKKVPECKARTSSIQAPGPKPRRAHPPRFPQSRAPRRQLAENQA